MKVGGKVIVVTGAGSGIGRELALALLAKGAKVAGVDLNAMALDETGVLAGSRGSEFEALVADVTDRPALERLPDLIFARFGSVDGIINNAGIIQPFLKLNDLDYATIERVLNVNLFGTLFATKIFLPHLLKRPEAHIVNLSSMGGFLPVPGQTIYCAAKAGVKLMSEGLASELIGTRVHVTVVFPGAIATNIRQNSGLSAPSGTVINTGKIKSLPASKAARVIVEAMERNAYHVFVGSDAALMNKLHRLNPAFAARAVAKKMSGLLTN